MMEASQAISSQLRPNRLDVAAPESSLAATSSPTDWGVATLPDVAAPSAAAVPSSTVIFGGENHSKKEDAPSKAQEIIALASLLMLPNRAAADKMTGSAAAAAAVASMAAVHSTRATSANRATRQQWGALQLAGQPAPLPSAAAAAAAATATAGIVRHSPRSLQQQRTSTAAVAPNAALAAAKERVREKQQQLLYYLACIAAGELLLRKIEMQQRRSKPPTALSRMTKPLPQLQEHPEKLRQQQQFQLLKLLQGKCAVQQRKPSLPRQKQQLLLRQKQRLSRSKRRLPTNAMQLLYFRLKRKLKQLELTQRRKETACERGNQQKGHQTQHQQQRERQSQPQERGEQQQQYQEQQQNQQQGETQQVYHQQSHQPYQGPQRNHSRVNHPQELQKQHERLEQQLQMNRLTTPQQKHVYSANAFLTDCDDTGGSSGFAAGSALGAMSSTAPVSPAAAVFSSTACGAPDFEHASTAQPCTRVHEGFHPLAAVSSGGPADDPSADDAATTGSAPGLASAYAATLPLPPADSLEPTAASKSLVFPSSAGACTTASADDEFPSGLERPSSVVLSRICTNQAGSLRNLSPERQKWRKQQQQQKYEQQQPRMSQLDAQIDGFRQFLQLSKGNLKKTQYHSCACFT
ncbi:hypothetical protein, conserved [Eimeria necatrix]|uniref:Uncharacterized protein n=1 Tax=Eimeria necatrix TaxID=51315 RepID=U6N183_9EIME|nr:hypothetical protein, conserved [Eimeria necatrix]CDJ67700.1 hypothetical protein, conserved [Eimeria necatrix]